MVVPPKVFPLPRKENRGFQNWGGFGVPAPAGTPTPVPSPGTHVSSWALSCFLRALSDFFHCRNAQSVALASLLTVHWSRSVHTSSPIRATLMFSSL